MKEPHRKGIANHPDPESCAGGGNIAGEALTGAHAGQLSSSEITSIGVPTLSAEGEGHTAGSVQSRAARRRRGVRDPEHAWKLCAREPGDPGNSPAGWRRGTVREGMLPHDGHARFQGVGRSHSTREAGEQSRPEGARSPWREGDRPRETPLEPYSRRTPSRESVAWDCGAYEKLQSGIRNYGSPPCCTMSLPTCFGQATSR